MSHYNTELYPPISALDQGFLKVDDLHDIYWEYSGNPKGTPILFIHGGPGGGTAPKHRQFFDPKHYKIIMYDQRGCGKSKPFGELKGNTTQNLVDDIEKLRVFLKIEKWHVFGGSWGSTLALTYAIQHPQRCMSLILRGIFMMRQLEIDWFMNSMGYFYPTEHKKFAEFIPEEERHDLLNAYYKRLNCGDKKIEMEAGKRWAAYESSCSYLIPQVPVESPDADLAIARIEAHYFLFNKFEPEDYILQNIDKIRHIPAMIVQGRYDVICPPTSAFELHEKWPEADFNIVNDSGHASSDPSMRAALVSATEKMKILS